ncbi:MAG: hypothetical protein GYA62_03905, partial [Bacteroidales bacterium]|nr:hypothetical protein [Bacteroidales bacterium]
MNVFNFEIKFEDINSVPDLLGMLNGIFNCPLFSEVTLKIDLRTSKKMIYPEYLAILIAVVKYLDSNACFTKITYIAPIEERKKNYISRMNFFKEIGIEVAEPFNRHDSTGKFIEITHFNSENNCTISAEIVKILRKNLEIETSVLSLLEYCFNEIIDNVDVHACSPIDGYTAVQNYTDNRELRLIVIDTGKGIYETLINNGESIHHGKCSNNAEALLLSIGKGITNGKGQGNGLFRTVEFIKNNKGELILYSGPDFICVNGDELRVFSGPFWQGTLLFMKI